MSRFSINTYAKLFEQIKPITLTLVETEKLEHLMKIPYVFIVQSFYNTYPMMVVLGSIWGI